MMPSNQFMFLDQVGAQNPHQQSQNLHQAFIQPDHFNPYQSNILQQRLAEPTHSPSPPQPQHALQYSTQSQLAVQSIMAPPSQSGLASQFFPQMGHQGQHQQHQQHQQQQFQARQQPQFHYSQMSGPNRMNPIQNGMPNSQNGNMLASLLTTTNNHSPVQFRGNQVASSHSPNQFKQMPQMIRQTMSTPTNNSVQYNFMQNSEQAIRNQNSSDFIQVSQPPRLIPSAQADEFRQTLVTKQQVIQTNFLETSLRKPNIEEEFRQAPASQASIPDEFLQAPVQKFGEQLDKGADDDVAGLIHNIHNISSKSSVLDDSVQEITDPKNDVDFDVDELVHELISEVDNSFVSNNNKEIVELNDSTEEQRNLMCADIDKSNIITSSPKQTEAEAPSLEEADSDKQLEEELHPNPVNNVQITLQEASPNSKQVNSGIEETSVVNTLESPKQNTENDATSEGNPSPIEESSDVSDSELPNIITEGSAFENTSCSEEAESTTSGKEKVSDLAPATESNQVTESCSTPVEEESNVLVDQPDCNLSNEPRDPIANDDPKSTESANPNQDGSNIELESETPDDTLVEKDLPDIKPTLHLKLRKDIFFSDSIDFSTQINVTNMEEAEREALLDSLHFTKEMRELTTPDPNMKPVENEQKSSIPDSRGAPFQNEQLNGILYGSLSTPSQFGRQFGFPELSQPSNIHPILGSILTQQHTSRNINFPPLSQAPTTSTNPFLHTNQLDFLYQNKLYGKQSTSTPPKPIKRKMDQELMGEHSQTPPVQRRRFPNTENKEPLYVDPTLPPGWSRIVSQRKTGASAGSWDVYVIHANGKRFRSRMDIKRYFEKTGETEYNWQDFDFNPFGSKGQQNPGKVFDTASLGEHDSAQLGEQLGVPESNAEMMEMEPDIQNFLSCELGPN